MVKKLKEKIIPYDFKKLRLKDFPASCTYVFTQKDFEKESHTICLDGTIYINKRVKGWEYMLEIARELSRMSMDELKQLNDLKKNSIKTEDIFLRNSIALEKNRREAEINYYTTN